MSFEVFSFVFSSQKGCNYIFKQCSFLSFVGRALTATRTERGSDSQNQSMASNSMGSTFFFMFDILVRAKHIEVSVKPHKSRNFWIKSVIFVVFEIKRHYCFRLMYDVQFVHFIQTNRF